MNQASYHNSKFPHAECALELVSNGANTVLGGVFRATEIYYKVTRDNLLKIADHYRDMVRDDADI